MEFDFASAVVVVLFITIFALIMREIVNDLF